MKCNLTVLFIIAAALVVLVFAWIAAAQGNSTEEVCGTSGCGTSSCAPACAPACPPPCCPAWYE